MKQKQTEMKILAGGFLSSCEGKKNSPRQKPCETNHTRWQHARNTTLYRNLCTYMPGFAYTILSLKVSIRKYFVIFHHFYAIFGRLSDVRTARLIHGRYCAFPVRYHANVSLFVPGRER